MAKTPKTATVPESAAATVSPDGDGKSAFVVTDKAPSRVAGRRVEKGETIRLTEEEARAELLALHIRPADLPPKQDAPKTEEPKVEAPSKDV